MTGKEERYESSSCYADCERSSTRARAGLGRVAHQCRSVPLASSSRGGARVMRLGGTGSSRGSDIRALIERTSVPLSRSTAWNHVKTLPLDFATFHPQGLVYVGDRAFLSSVEILEEPRRVPPVSNRTAGRGRGHLFVIDGDGKLVRDVPVGEGDTYHPGGMDFDGSRIWVPLAEYRAASNTIVLTVDPVDFAVSEMFRVKDHVSWVVSDAANEVVYGANWGSRRFFTWGLSGELLDEWANPSDFVDYQDCQYLGPGRVICGGVSALPCPDGDTDGRYELGGIAVVNLLNRQIVHETAVALFSSAGHVVTFNPFTVTADAHNLFLHVAPDDGTDPDGTEILTYKTEIAAPCLGVLPHETAQQ